MKPILVVAAAAVAVGGFAQAAPKHHAVHHAVAKPLSPIEAALAAAQRDHARKQGDPYAADTPINLTEGQPFKIDVSADSASPGALVFYQAGAVKLSVNPNSALPDINHPGLATFEMIEIGHSSRSRGHWVGSNAFGATRDLASYSEQTNAIALFSSPDIPENRGRPPWQRSDRYEFEMPNVPGPQAKEIVTRARLVIEGTVTKTPDSQQFTGCRDFYAGATVDAPTETSESICYVGANVTRIAFVNGATGEVLKEWTTAPAN